MSTKNMIMINQVKLVEKTNSDTEKSVLHGHIIIYLFIKQIYMAAHFTW